MSTENNPTELTLRHCMELVGPFQRMEDDGRILRVAIHDRTLAYPAGSAEAETLQDALGEVPAGTRVGILRLILDGRPRVFVRIKEKKS